jgi:hypothetical protein
MDLVLALVFFLSTPEAAAAWPLWFQPTRELWEGLVGD